MVRGKTALETRLGQRIRAHIAEPCRPPDADIVGRAGVCVPRPRGRYMRVQAIRVHGLSAAYSDMRRGGARVL